MDNIFEIVLFGLLLAILVLFLVIRNKKDRKSFENQMNQDYKKKKEDEQDIDIDLKAD